MSIYVVFFGGWHASSTDMELWRTTANNQRKDVTFDAIPFPSPHADAIHAVGAFEKKFAGVIKEIKDSGADTIYIVGHSSGCALANELNSRIGGDHSHITLVTLDGFAPDDDQINGSNTVVWSAISNKLKPAEKGRKPKPYVSLNHDVLQKRYGSALQEWHSDAIGVWALHFSVVNSAASDKIEDASTGYAGCVANLMWLP